MDQLVRLLFTLSIRNDLGKSQEVVGTANTVKKNTIISVLKLSMKHKTSEKHSFTPINRVSVLQSR